MQQKDRIEVLRLTRLDPQMAVDAISKLFASGDAKQAPLWSMPIR